MAVTNQKSDIYTNLTAVPLVVNARPGMLIFQPFTHTQSGAGDANSTVHLWRIPAGSRLYLHQSILKWTAFGAARVLRLGWDAYTNPDGTAVAADDDGIFAALDVAAAGYAHFAQAPTMGVGVTANLTREFEGSANLALMVTGGTWPDAAVISGLIAYAPSGS